MTLLPAVVSTLEELQQENKQVEVATEAATLLNSVQKRTFLIAALVMQHTSGIIPPVSKLLQKKELDIFAVIELIDVTVKSIILFGLWAKIPFPHLATSDIPSWVRPWM